MATARATSFNAAMEQKVWRAVPGDHGSRTGVAAPDGGTTQRRAGGWPAVTRRARGCGGLCLVLVLALLCVGASPAGAQSPPAPPAAAPKAAPAAATPRRPLRGKVRLEIRGVGDELAQAARANLELQDFLEREVTGRQLRGLVARGEQQIRRGLEPYGYYEARATGRLERIAEGWRVTFTIEPGEPARVRRSQVRVLGSGAELKPVREALQAFAPKPGQALDHALYEASKARIGTALQTNGYFDATLDRHRVEVTRAARSADIDLAWNGGERYRLGATSFSAVQFPDEFLQGYLPWEPGAFYSVDDLLVLQQRLIDADYFSLVSVQPDVARRADGAVPVEVLLTPAKRTIYTAGAYVSTDLGPGGRLGIQRRWINDQGHKWGAEVEYSTRLQAVGTTYRIPRPGVRNRYFEFAAGYRDETTDTSRSTLKRLSASEVLDRWHGYQRTLGLRLLDGNFTIADELRSSKLLYAEGALARKRVDDQMFPQRGVAVNYLLRLAAPGLLSDSSLAQLRADARWVRPAGRDSRLILRASAGALDASNFDALPPDLRFFAGGDRSVRGFDYQAIGERNATGGVIGGRNLAVASAEYEHFFLERWGAAVFVDAGDAFSSDFNANVGAGIGVRWKSPVGIVRVDFAVPVSTDLEDRGLRFHIVIGPDL
jgi:translocation and assembly module TamA